MSIQTKKMVVKSDTSVAETSTTIRDTVTFDVSKMPNGITYKGLKAVLSFADPIQWNKASTYDALTVVWDDASHGSYASKRPVPANIELTNEFYWLRTADLDAQVEMYRQEVREMDGRVTANAHAISAETARAEKAEQDIILNMNNKFVYVTPEEYGAKGDGITDDTEAVQTALSHKYVFMSKKYNVKSLNIDDSAIIVGGEFVLASDSQIYINADNVSFLFVNFTGPFKDVNSITKSYIYAVDSDYLNIHNCNFNCAGTINVGLTNSNNVTIENCSCINSPGTSFRIDQSNNVIIDNCTIINKPVAGNAGNQGLHCIDVNAQSGNTDNVTISNCDISNFWGVGIQFTGNATKEYLHGNMKVFNCNIHDPLMRETSAEADAIKVDAMYGNLTVENCNFAGKFLTYGIFSGGTSGSAKNITVKTTKFNATETSLRMGDETNNLIVEGCEFTSGNSILHYGKTLNLFIMHNCIFNSTSDFYIWGEHDAVINKISIHNNKIDCSNMSIGIDVKPNMLSFYDNVVAINGQTDNYGLNRIGYFTGKYLRLTNNVIIVPNNTTWSNSTCFRTIGTTDTAVVGANICNNVKTGLYEESTVTTLIKYGE